MSNAFDAVYDEVQGASNSSSSSILDEFKEETRSKASQVFTYDEIFNIQKSLQPIVDAKFRTLDESSREQFRQRVVEVTQKYSNEISNVTEDLVLSEGEKKFEVNKLMNDMVQELTSEAEKVYAVSIDDTAEATRGSYSDKDSKESSFITKALVMNENGQQNLDEAITGAEERATGMLNAAKENYTVKNVVDSIEEVNSNFVTDLSHIAITEAFGTIINSDTTAYTINPVLLAKDITESFTDSAINFVSSAKENFLDAPVELADGLTDVAKGIAKTIVDIPETFSRNLSEEFGGKIRSLKDDLVHTAADKFMNLKNTAANKIERAVVGDSLSKTKVTGTESIFDRVTVSPISRDQFKVLSATSSEDGVTNTVVESIYMSLDNYWDVNITVPYENWVIGLPSFRQAYGLVEKNQFYHLPITSFNMIGDGIINSEESIYPGMSIPIPIVRQRPSKLNIQLPELIHRKVGYICPCMLKFKYDYINFVTLRDKENANTFRDYRDCVYEITIRKFSPRWEMLFEVGYYGVPDINIQESGSSSPTVEYSELTFSIVGEFDPKLNTQTSVHTSALENSKLSDVSTAATKGVNVMQETSLNLSKVSNELAKLF